MAKAIPLTHLSEYVPTAKAIRRTAGVANLSCEELRKAVEALADLAVKALEEAHQSIEGLAVLMMVLHPELKRKRAPHRA